MAKEKYGMVLDNFELLKKLFPQDSSYSVLNYIIRETQSGFHPITETATAIAKEVLYCRQAVQKSLKDFEKGGIITIEPSQAGKKIVITLNWQLGYDSEKKAYDIILTHTTGYTQEQEERKKKKSGKKKPDAPEFDSPDEVNAVMANDFSHIQTSAPQTTSNPEDDKYSFDTPEELFEITKDEVLTQTDIEKITEKGKTFLGIPEDRRQEYIDAQLRAREAVNHKVTKEEREKNIRAASKQFDDINAAQAKRLEYESKNF